MVSAWENGHIRTEVMRSHSKSGNLYWINWFNYRSEATLTFWNSYTWKCKVDLLIPVVTMTLFSTGLTTWKIVPVLWRKEGMMYSLSYSFTGENCVTIWLQLVCGYDLHWLPEKTANGLSADKNVPDKSVGWLIWRVSHSLRLIETVSPDNMFLPKSESVPLFLMLNRICKFVSLCILPTANWLAPSAVEIMYVVDNLRVGMIIVPSVLYISSESKMTTVDKVIVVKSTAFDSFVK